MSACVSLHGGQVTNYRFDSSAIEVAGLAVLRWVVLAAVLMRSRACLVRVKGDGTIIPSIDAVIALAVCAISAGYCVFKVTFGRRKSSS